MAVTLDELRATMRMELTPFMRDLQKMNGVNTKSAKQLEATWRATNKRLDAIGVNMARSLITPLLGVGAALSVDSVARYADAWTSAKNSLSVAGVLGENQVAVLDKLYQSAQNNAAPLTAMADLFGKAAQASDNLGASQAELLKFSDGVGVALRVAGSSASQASGALTQLGQLLGSARVQAEEFNSINDGARPILMAVAAGLDEAGGSVSKLKTLVNDGKVSGQQFFQAFLKGLPAIQSMAANATQTIDQGMTKVNNAFIKFIGQSDEGLGASARLSAGLNSLADNFDETADMVLKVASVIAAALVGRSIAGMIASLGLATGAIFRFIAALRAAGTVAGLATAMSGLSVAAGPIGTVVGVAAVGALALFASSSEEAGEGARRFSDRLARMGDAAENAAQRTEAAGGRINEVLVNGLTKEVAQASDEVKAASDAVISLFDNLFANVDRDTISPEQLRQLEALKEGLQNGSIEAGKAQNALFALANANPDFQAVANAFKPLLDKLAEVVAGAKQARAELATASGATLSEEQKAGYKQYAASRMQGEEMVRLGKAYSEEAQRQNGLSKEQLATEKEIASIKKDLAEKGGFLPDDKIKALAASNVAASEGRSKSGKSGPKGVKQTADSRFDGDIQAVRDRTAALIEEQRIVGLSYQESEKRRMALDLEQTALADLREEARRKGQTDLENIQLSSDQRSKIDEASDAYARQAEILRQLEQAQSEAQSSAQEFYDTAKSGFIDAITGAQSLGDALKGLANKFADLLLGNGFDLMFGGGPSKNAGGGLLTSIFKGLGFRETGGPVKKGQPYVVGERRAEVFVPDSNGKIVPRVPSVPALPDISQMGGGRGYFSLSPSYQIDARGTDGAAISRMETALEKSNRELTGNVLKIMKQVGVRGIKV